MSTLNRKQRRQALQKVTEKGADNSKTSADECGKAQPNIRTTSAAKSTKKIENKLKKRLEVMKGQRTGKTERDNKKAIEKNPDLREAILATANHDMSKLKQLAEKATSKMTPNQLANDQANLKKNIDALLSAETDKKTKPKVKPATNPLKADGTKKKVIQKINLGTESTPTADTIQKAAAVKQLIDMVGVKI